MGETFEKNQETRHQSPHKSMSYVFGTLAGIVITGKTAPFAREAATAVFDEFDRLHWKLHAWKSGDLVKLNGTIATGKRRVEVDAETSALIRGAADLSIKSEGLFNPAIGRLVGLWNFHTDECLPHLPDRTDIERMVLANPQMSDFALLDDRLDCENPSAQLDFGGYAKGYALDRAACLLLERGVRDAFINIGGHIMALGRRGGRPWSVGIRHPRLSGLFARLDLHDGEIISTSGDYERYFVVNEKRYSHIIDPRTGYPAREIHAATVLIPPGPGAGALSDAASSALFIAGPQKWREAADRMRVSHAMLVENNGAIHLSDEMRARLEFI